MLRDASTWSCAGELNGEGRVKSERKESGGVDGRGERGWTGWFSY